MSYVSKKENCTLGLKTKTQEELKLYSHRSSFTKGPLLSYATKRATCSYMCTGNRERRSSKSVARSLISNSGVASYGALWHVPPRLPTISCLVHFDIKLRANSPSIV